MDVTAIILFAISDSTYRTAAHSPRTRKSHIRSSACQVAMFRQPPGSWSGGWLPSPPCLGCERVLELGHDVPHGRLLSAIHSQTRGYRVAPARSTILSGTGSVADPARGGQSNDVPGRSFNANQRMPGAAAHVTNASGTAHRKPSAPEGMAMVCRALRRAGRCGSA